MKTNSGMLKIVKTVGMMLMIMLVVGCGMGEAIVERGIEEAVDRAGGEGTMATVEAAATQIVDAAATQMAERDTDGDGEISEEEQQAMLDAPGAMPTNPLDLPLGEIVTDNATQGTMGRHYRASLPAGAITTLQLTNNGEPDLYLTVSNLPSGVDLPDTIGGGKSADATFIVGQETELLVSVLTIFGQADFELLVSAEAQNDADSGGDAGDGDNATNIDPATGLTGQFGGADDEDAYRLRIPSGDLMEVTLTNGADNNDPIDFSVQTTNGSYWSSDPILPGNSATLIVGEMDEYFANIIINGEASGGTYTLDAVAVGQDDAGSGSDAPDLPSDALATSFGTTVSGMSIAGDVDCYGVTLSADGAIVIDLRSPSDQPFESSARVELYTASGDYKNADTVSYGATTTLEFGVVDYETAVADDYAVCVSGDGYYPFTAYEVTVTTP